MFTLSGHVNRPANYEIEMAKSTFHDLIYDPKLGGGIRDNRELKAFVPGGVSAPWFGPDQVEMALDQDAVGKAGSMLGSGSVVVMDDTTCMVRAAWRISTLTSSPSHSSIKRSSLPWARRKLSRFCSVSPSG